jgi:hypothetical protein
MTGTIQHQQCSSNKSGRVQFHKPEMSGTMLLVMMVDVDTPHTDVWSMPTHCRNDYVLLPIIPARRAP